MEKDLRYYWSFCEKVNDKNWCNLPEENKLKAGFDEGGIFYTDDEIIVAIDGSSDTQEWISNFRFNSNDLGFHHEFFNVAVEFNRLLQRLIPIGKKITFVGHSRGGLVQIIAYLMNRPNAHVITFASPKVANIKGHKLLKKSDLTHTRVRIKGDVVDNLPPVVMGYIHYDDEVITLSRVKGQLNHIAFREALEKYYK